MALAVGKLPAGDRLYAGAATNTDFGGRRHPLAIALATMAKNIVVIRCLKNALPFGQFCGREVGRGLLHRGMMWER